MHLPLKKKNIEIARVLDKRLVFSAFLLLQLAKQGWVGLGMMLDYRKLLFEAFTSL